MLLYGVSIIHSSFPFVYKLTAFVRTNIARELVNSCLAFLFAFEILPFGWLAAAGCCFELVNFELFKKEERYISKKKKPRHNLFSDGKLSADTRNSVMTAHFFDSEYINRRERNNG